MRRLVDSFRRAFGISALQDELRRMSKRIDALESHARLETKWRGHFTGKVDALLRHDYLDDLLEEGGPAYLLSHRFKLLSQNEEDGVTLALLKRIGTSHKTFVEIGSGASGGNSGVLAQELGWRGLMVDIDQDKIDRARAKFGSNAKVSFEAIAVSPDNINALIERHGFKGEIDLLSLDIDSFDYWVLEALSVCTPRMMILEYNSSFGPDRSLTIAPETDMSRAPKGFHGASLKALTKLACSKGYKLVVCDESGTNAFYVRRDLCPDIEPVDPEMAFRPTRDSGDPMRERMRIPKDLDAIAEQHGLRLIEV